MKLFRKMTVLAIVIIFSLVFLAGCFFKDSQEMENAKTCMSLGQYTKALGQLKKELDNNSGNDGAYVLKGECFTHLIEYKEALTAFNFALKLEEKNNEKISLFCIEMAKKLAKEEKVMRGVLVHLVKYSGEINPSLLEANKKLLEELALSRLNEFKDFNTAESITSYLCKSDESFKPRASEIFYIASKDQTKHSKLMYLMKALYYGGKYDKEIAEFLIKQPMAVRDNEIYSCIKKYCQEEVKTSLKVELAQVREKRVKQLNAEANYKGGGLFRDTNASKRRYKQLYQVASPDKAYKDKYLRIGTNRTETITLNSYILSQELICRGNTTYVIKADKPFYITYFDPTYGFLKSKHVKKEFTVSGYFSSWRSIAVLSLDKTTNFSILKK